MFSPKFLLPLLLAIAFIGFSGAQEADQEAVEVCHNFFKGFMKAIQSKDLLKVLSLFSPQKGDTTIDAAKLIQELQGLRVSFRFAKFVGSDISASVVFRPPKTERAAKSAEFVLEKDPATSVWTIKSMTELKDVSAEDSLRHIA